MQLVNMSNNKIIATEVEMAGSFGKRLKGLLGRKNLPTHRALVLKPCNSVHTFFMRFPIDVLFISPGGQILKIISQLPPNRVSPIVRKAGLVIELAAGQAAATQTLPGDYIKL